MSQTEQEAEQRGLARSVGADEADAAARDVNREVVEGRDRRIALGQSVDVEQRWCDGWSLAAVRSERPAGIARGVRRRSRAEAASSVGEASNLFASRARTFSPRRSRRRRRRPRDPCGAGRPARRRHPHRRPATCATGSSGRPSTAHPGSARSRPPPTVARGRGVRLSARGSPAQPASHATPA